MITMPSPSIQRSARQRPISRGAVVLACLGACLSAGCSWIPPFLSPDFSWTYKIDIQQGVVVTQEMANQLKPGMTPDQVKFVMGSPPLIDPFHADRWDYPYRFQPGRGPVEERRFTVFFKDGRMASSGGDPLPTEKEFVASRIRINAKEGKPIPEGDDKRYAPKPSSSENSGPVPAQPASSGADSSGSTPNEQTSTESSSPSLWQRFTGLFGGGSSKPSQNDSPASPAPPPGAVPTGAGPNANP